MGRITLGTTKTTSHMDMESLFLPMDRAMKANGYEIRNMEKVLRNGPTEPCSLEPLSRESKLGTGSSYGKTVSTTRESSPKILWMEQGFTSGQTADDTTAYGRKIRCTSAEFSRGPMAANMTVSTKRTRNMATVSSPGHPGRFMTEPGLTVDNTGSASSSSNMEKQAVRGSGTKDSGFDGSMQTQVK
jgi:hypothetical protein